LTDGVVRDAEAGSNAAAGWRLDRNYLAVQTDR
jgi:hypothetical protein